MISWTTGSASALVALLFADLQANLGTYVQQIATSSAMPLKPVPAGSVYAGQWEADLGVWPSVGLYLEADARQPMQTQEEDVVWTLAATIVYSEADAGATLPPDMYRAALAYAEAVAECLVQRAVLATGAAGVWRAEKINVRAETSPYARDTTGQRVWTVAAALCRVRLYQTIERR